MLNNNITHNTIIDYLSHQLTYDDQIKFEKWLDESDENVAIVQTIKKSWNVSKAKPSEKRKQAWNKLTNSIEERQQGFIKRNYFSIAVAASLLILITSGWFLKNTTTKMVSIVTNEDTFRRDTLENGCIVYLYPSSSIEVQPKLSFTNKQEIKLNGEAFFIVPPNMGNNVSINVGGASIKVTGTSFRVKGNSDKEVSVLVESGEVILKSKTKTKNKLIVAAGEEGYFFNKNNELWKKPKTENIYLIYQPNTKAKEPC